MSNVSFDSLQWRDRSYGRSAFVQFDSGTAAHVIHIKGNQSYEVAPVIAGQELSPHPGFTPQEVTDILRELADLGGSKTYEYNFSAQYTLPDAMDLVLSIAEDSAMDPHETDAVGMVRTWFESHRAELEQPKASSIGNWRGGKSY